MEQVYTPIVIQDNPLPDQMPVTETAATGADSSTSHVSQPSAMPNTLIPRKMVAQETIGESLNTKTRKILSDYSFTQQGAIQIGEYKPGVSGDIRQSPAGIVARNLAGETTFAVDGDTGDATFKGQVRASSFLNDLFSVDAQGNVIAQSIQIASQSVISAIDGVNQIVIAETDLTNAAFTLVLERRTVVLITVDVKGWVYLDSGSTPYMGHGITRLYSNGAEFRRCIISGGVSATGDGLGNTTSFATAIGSVSMTFIATFSPGTKNIKLTGACDIEVGSPHFNIYGWDINIVTLGNG